MLADVSDFFLLAFLSDDSHLLEREKQDLLDELSTLPQNAVIRRINELVKR